MIVNEAWKLNWRLEVAEDQIKTNNEVDEARRSAMLTMAKVMAYVPPAVATFAMGGLSIREAHAYVVNL